MKKRYVFVFSWAIVLIFKQGGPHPHPEFEPRPPHPRQYHHALSPATRPNKMGVKLGNCHGHIAGARLGGVARLDCGCSGVPFAEVIPVSGGIFQVTSKLDSSCDEVRFMSARDFRYQNRPSFTNRVGFRKRLFPVRKWTTMRESLGLSW
jgi:hypothetical protein